MQAYEMNACSDPVNQPEHYRHGIECIDEMLIVFGPFETAAYCKLAAYKYRKRCLYKANPQEDMDKSEWYMKKYLELTHICRSPESRVKLDNDIYGKYFGEEVEA